VESLPNVPDGYAVTTGVPDDLSELVTLVGAVQQKYDGVASASDSFWRAMLSEPQIDPSVDIIQIRTAATGELVAFAKYANLAPHVESYTSGFVHPDHEGVGLGTLIVRWALARSQTMEREASPGTMVTTLVEANATNTAARSLFEENGYSANRYFLEMGRTLDTPVSVLPIPDGLTVRSMQGIEDIELIVDPVTDAFRDHYGYVETTRESEVEQWHRWRATDQWDDSLVWIVEANGVPIAVNVSITALGARTDTGLVASLSVLREWRGRGIARSLLTMSFAEFQRRGTPNVALHVDADSLTGAKRLYESVGMSESQRYVDFSREIRPGTDVVVR
jgi:ribosomal protein S18 acetylase RimI-like enzyme